MCLDVAFPGGAPYGFFMDRLAAAFRAELAAFTRLVAVHGMTDAVQIGELPFRWHTEYAFPWMGGWVHNQEGKAYERNLLVRIPGRDRKRAVVMADHYDTAYMYDWYEKGYGGTGARLAAGSDLRRARLRRAEPSWAGGMLNVESKNVEC